MPATYISKWLLVILFITALWLPLIITVVGPKQEVSRVEKRRLTVAPIFTLREIHRYAGRFEKYYNDHFGLRRLLVRGFNQVHVIWLGVSNTEWVLLGKNGWLFQGGNPHVREMRNGWPYAQNELDHWGVVLSEKHQWLESQGISYLFVFTPNKSLSYPEHLPRHINKVRYISRLDQVVGYLKENTDVPILDLRPALTRARENMRTYHVTDTHWNDYGAYIGYRAIMAAVESKLPKLQPLELKLNDFEVVDAPGGDLAQMLDMQTIIREQRIQPKQSVERCARNPTLGPKPSDKVRFERSFATYCKDAPYRVLIFRDSYALALMPYLSESFGYIYYHTQTPVSLAIMKKLVKRLKPDLVIEQRASRWLRSPTG